MQFKYITINNHKIKKSLSRGYFTGILHLAPNVTSGKNTCAYATKGCIKSCLYESGFSLRYDHINQARIRKTREFFLDKSKFISYLIEDVNRLNHYALKKQYKPAIRLNGTSDINWNLLTPNIFNSLPHIQFYDYTKNYNLVLVNDVPNWHLTYSRAENTTTEQIDYLVGNEKNVAVVFRPVKKQLPAKYLNYNVLDGDEDDLRFLDPPGNIIGLRSKAHAWKDETGFVIK